jgi:hypothetical protein
MLGNGQIATQMTKSIGVVGIKKDTGRRLSPTLARPGTAGDGIIRRKGKSSAAMGLVPTIHQSLPLRSRRDRKRCRHDADSSPVIALLWLVGRGSNRFHIIRMRTKIGIGADGTLTTKLTYWYLQSLVPEWSQPSLNLD